MAISLALLLAATHALAPSQPPVTLHYTPKHRLHRNRRGHPEHPGRLDEFILPTARNLGDAVAWRELGAPRSDALDAVLRVHDGDHVARVERASARRFGRARLGPDTFVNRRSHEAFLCGVSLWLDAVDGALNRSSGVEFALSRPPGHHAGRASADGFCVYNYCAAAAAHALDVHKCDWVAILDWDAHHGNGVAAYADEDPRICYASVHQAPLWPNTGDDASDRGFHGNRLSAPVARGAGPAAFEAAWRSCVDFCEAFAEKRGGRGLVIVCAGFDALEDDPLVQCRLGVDDFAPLMEAVLDWQPTVVAGLEGGYCAAMGPALRAGADPGAGGDLALLRARRAPDGGRDDGGRVALCSEAALPPRGGLKRGDVRGPWCPEWAFGAGAATSRAGRSSTVARKAASWVLYRRARRDRRTLATARIEVVDGAATVSRAEYDALVAAVAKTSIPTRQRLRARLRLDRAMVGPLPDDAAYYDADREDAIRVVQFER
ncbi:NAD-dependent histone deacetylase (H3-K14 specific) [Aureococcus anophagefferens]|uniref:NAD-dependent histone deacetylase (H3-K14 specific) n=2 Tax=Aureococcus anophagefferens TaxID=44056 RepID=A0ABR1FKB3_AURAN